MGRDALSYADQSGYGKRPKNRLADAGLLLFGAGWLPLFGGLWAISTFGPPDRAHVDWLLIASAVLAACGLPPGITAVVIGPNRHHAVGALSLQVGIGLAAVVGFCLSR